MKRKRVFLFLMVTSLVFTSGCWSQKELNDLAIISATSFDHTKDGRYLKTIQVLNPGNVAGGLQGGGGGSSPTVSVFTTTGDTVFEAHSNGANIIPRRLYHSHSDLLIVGEELAREEGLETILEAFTRYPEARSTTNIVIARGMKGGDLLKTLTVIENIPSEKINRTMQFAQKSKGQYMMVSIQDFLQDVTSPGKTPVLPGFEVDGNPEDGKKMENIQQSKPNAIMKAHGLAVFKEGKLIDWYDGDVARGVTWLTNEIFATDIEIEWEGEENAVVYHMQSQDTQVSATVKKGIPTINIQVQTEGDVVEVRKPVELGKPQVLSEIEEAIEEDIKNQLKKTIEKAQKDKADVFGFGEKVHIADPKLWKKKQKDWDDKHFPKLKVNITVDSLINRSGMRMDSYLTEIEKRR